MEHQEQQKHLDFLANFPWHQYPNILENQKEALEIISKQQGSVILELPTGSGKTAIGYTFLKTLARSGYGPLFYITPTKTLVDQLKRLHPDPDIKIVYGRNEYPCLYYKDQIVTAEETPCSMLDCPHRVNQETGETELLGAISCPYLSAKYQARQGGIIACTVAFYLFIQLFSEEWKRPAGLVIDEVHRLANAVRSSLSYEISDYQLKRFVELLSEIGISEAKIIDSFSKKC